MRKKRLNSLKKTIESGARLTMGVVMDGSNWDSHLPWKYTALTSTKAALAMLPASTSWGMMPAVAVETSLFTMLAASPATGIFPHMFEGKGYRLLKSNASKSFTLAFETYL